MGEGKSPRPKKKIRLRRESTRPLLPALTLTMSVTKLSTFYYSIQVVVRWGIVEDTRSHCRVNHCGSVCFRADSVLHLGWVNIWPLRPYLKRWQIKRCRTKSEISSSLSANNRSRWECGFEYRRCFGLLHSLATVYQRARWDGNGIQELHHHIQGVFEGLGDGKRY